MAITPTQITSAAATLAGLASPTADTRHAIAVCDGLSPKAARSLALYAVLVLRDSDQPAPVLDLARTIAEAVQDADADSIDRVA